MDTLPGIDVVIPTYGRGRRALDVAAALLPQLSAKDEIFIVWQDAADTVLDQPQIHRVVLDRPSLPAARNAGARSGHNDIVLFIDDDVEPLAGLVDGHRRAYAREDIGAVAGFVDDRIFVQSRPQPSQFDQTTGELLLNFMLDHSAESLSVLGGNMSVRRTALEAVGGFDERYLHNALWEEVDCSFRLRTAGYRLWYCHTARLKHLRLERSGCWRDGKAKYLYHQFANTAYFACRFMPRRYWRSWVRFWWYRLEYLTRRKAGRPRHHLWLACAGVWGAACGVGRWVWAGGKVRSGLRRTKEGRK